MLVAAALRQSGWYRGTKVDVVNDGAKGMRSLVTDISPRVAAPMLDWFHLAMKLQAVRSPLFASHWIPAPEIIRRCRALWKKVRDALWRGRGALAIELACTLVASLAEAIPTLPASFALVASTARGAATRLVEFLRNNATILVDYARERKAGRRISTAPAESAMNHLINRRMSKRQSMRWSLKGAQFMLQTRVELLDGLLPAWFKPLHPRWRSPELVPTC